MLRGRQPQIEVVRGITCSIAASKKKPKRL
jgi:hypothetical protein